MDTFGLAVAAMSGAQLAIEMDVMLGLEQSSSAL
jgi:hypothetical protein